MLERLLEQVNVVVVLFVVIVLMFIWLLFLYGKMRKLERRYNAFMKDVSGETSLEERLADFQKETDALRDQLGDTRRRLMFVEENLPQCLQKVGIVRYNAFDDVGSDLSFAVALLDEKGNGVVFSSLYARDDNRIYAKPVTKGLSKYQLTEEEQAAINQAMEQIPRRLMAR
ncbi:MAG: DUF4446 family protein [Thermoanaerobacteraceae bacterium]|nr:DUF4446 family protein [Thermoanaerobacteraceae bacterium]